MAITQKEIDMEEIKKGILKEVLTKLVEENYTPEVILEVIGRKALLNCTSKNILNKIKELTEFHWDEGEKVWYTYDGKLIDYKSNLTQKSTKEIDEKEVAKERIYVGSNLKSIIKDSSLQRINLIELEVAVDEKVNIIENKKSEEIDNNIKTIMKDIKSLDSNIKQIARNFNRLINCLTEELDKS